MKHHPNEPTIWEDLPPSKSHKKREAHHLQDLAKTLVETKPHQLPNLSFINMPESLLEAIDEAKKIHAHGGKSRQLQYLGRLMRDWAKDDPEEVEKLSTLITNEHHRQRQENKLEQAVERFVKEFTHSPLKKHEELVGKILSVYPRATPKAKADLQNLVLGGGDNEASRLLVSKPLRKKWGAIIRAVVLSANNVVVD